MWVRVPLEVVSILLFMFRTFFALLLLSRPPPATAEISHSSSLAVEHRSYEPGVAGSIPAWSIAWRL